jgi:hypothetical protein
MILYFLKLINHLTYGKRYLYLVCELKQIAILGGRTCSIPWIQQINTCC